MIFTLINLSMAAISLTESEQKLNSKITQQNVKSEDVLQAQKDFANEQQQWVNEQNAVVAKQQADSILEQTNGTWNGTGPINNNPTEDSKPATNSGSMVAISVYLICMAFF